MQQLVIALVRVHFLLWQERQSKLWRVAFAACTAVVLVPAALLEFRCMFKQTGPLLSCRHGGIEVCLRQSRDPTCINMAIGCRYFLVPFVMLALHMQPMGARQLALTAAGYTVINAATIYVFLFRPFDLTDGSIARLW